MREYTKDYAWIDRENGLVIMGVAEKGAKMVDEFVFLELPKKKEEVKEGQDIIHLEALKWTGNIKSPVNGIVEEVNEEVLKDPSIINKNPENVWLIKIKEVKK